MVTVMVMMMVIFIMMVMVLWPSGCRRSQGARSYAYKHAHGDTAVSPL
jgi:small-conductance mechanosensitive channel